MQGTPLEKQDNGNIAQVSDSDFDDFDDNGVLADDGVRALAFPEQQICSWPSDHGEPDRKLVLCVNRDQLERCQQPCPISGTMHMTHLQTLSMLLFKC